MTSPGGVYFLSHESPMMWDTPSAARDALVELGRAIGKPKGVLFVSPHWLTQLPSVSISKEPTTIHDFGGFAKHYYDVSYPAPGAPELADKVIECFKKSNLAVLPQERGFDHAVWIVSSLLWPKADVPIVSFSLLNKGTPEQLFDQGRALSSLASQGYIVIASGTWTHNLGEFFSDKNLKMNDAAAPYVTEFTSWMLEKLHHNDKVSLFDYRKKAPHAYQAHPTPDHINALFFAMGAAGERIPKLLHLSTCYGFLSMVHIQWA